MVAGDKIFLDTDVLLDHLADRQPFAEYAHRILALAETEKLTVCASSLSFSNLYYILRKLNGQAEAIALLKKLTLLVHVSTVSEVEIHSALSSTFKDFEDAIQNFAAVAEQNVTALITRNTGDYTASQLTIMAPEQFLGIRESY